MAGPEPGDTWYIQTTATDASTTIHTVSDEVYARARIWVKLTSPGYGGTLKIPEPEPTSNELGEIAP